MCVSVCVVVKGVNTKLARYSKIAITLNISCVQDITCFEAIVQEGGWEEGSRREKEGGGRERWWDGYKEGGRKLRRERAGIRARWMGE